MFIGKKTFCKENYKVVIIMRFILHQNIVSKLFLVDALLNIEHLLESQRLIHIISVLKPGPARRVDPGPGRPGHGTGPGGGKNPLGSWPGETRSTRRVNPGPGLPGQTRLRPGLFFFILLDVKRRRFGICFKGQNDEEQ